MHVDLDAFFAAVEQRDKPSLRGRPVVVGGVGGRGVVSTASYEARRFGVGSAMPTAEARRRCPNAAFLAGRFPAYRAASALVLGLLERISPVVEPLSLDEAYVDLRAAGLDLATDPDGARAAGEEFRRRTEEVAGLTVSVGIATSKLVAKIASDLDKPDGLRVVAAGTEAEVLAPLPVRRLPGVGPVTEDRLHRHGFREVGQLAAADLAELVDLLGSAHGRGLHAAARGLDDRAVVPERDPKSVSAEETFPVDLVDRAVLLGHLHDMSARVARRLASQGLLGRTVSVKVRRYDFSTVGRSTTATRPVDTAEGIAAAATRLLDQLDVADGVRLLGVGVSGLTEFDQTELLPDLVPVVFDVSAAEPAPDVQGAPSPVAPAVVTPAGPEVTRWLPGEDVEHDEEGPGWVQGSGVGRVTVRFEGPHTAVGRVRTYLVDDPALRRTGPPVW